MPAIYYIPDDVELDVESTQTILNASLAAGIPHTHVCGGNARCSTCRVVILEGLENVNPRNEKETTLATRLGFAPAIRLACQSTLQGYVRLRRLVLDEEDVNVVERLRDSKMPIAIGEELNIAILFSDIRGFTPFAESLLAYDVIHVLNRYYDLIGQVITANGGFINNYMGDGIMALFGVDGQPDAALRAVRAGLAMLEEVEKLKPYLTATYHKTFEIGIGIHYGEAVVGPIGARNMKSMTAIGDAVNFASRIESANKEAETRFLISADTYNLLQDKLITGKQTCVSLKGKSGQYDLYEVLGLQE
ncbi:MAG: adenylate/guanylate cyclase domain-containing protein [Anaerolineae bacterium]